MSVVERVVHEALGRRGQAADNCGVVCLEGGEDALFRDGASVEALFDNADEPEMEVPDPAAEAKRAEIEAKVAKLKADLPDKWPGADDAARKDALEHAFAEW